MSTTKLLAKHLREVYFGGNWTCSDFKANLKDVTWEQAITKVKDFNTIAVLFYHSAYYVSGVLQFLKGEKFESKDAESFSHHQ